MKERAKYDTKGSRMDGLFFLLVFSPSRFVHLIWFLDVKPLLLSDSATYLVKMEKENSSKKSQPESQFSDIGDLKTPGHGVNSIYYSD